MLTNIWERMNIEGNCLWGLMGLIAPCLCGDHLEDRSSEKTIDTTLDKGGSKT